MCATNQLRQDHKTIKQFENILVSCYTRLYAGYDVPIGDLEDICYVVSEFLDSIHYSREEDSYFPCVTLAQTEYKTMIRKFVIEHEFSRNIAAKISKEVELLKHGTKTSTEPVARYMRAYCIYLKDHLEKEEKFFSEIENDVLSDEEEREIYEQFLSLAAISPTLEKINKTISLLQQKEWMSWNQPQHYYDDGSGK